MHWNKGGKGLRQGLNRASSAVVTGKKDEIQQIRNEGDIPKILESASPKDNMKIREENHNCDSPRFVPSINLACL